VDNRVLLTASDVAEKLGTSKSYAYRIIKTLNKELEEQPLLSIKDNINIHIRRYKSNQDSKFDIIFLFKINSSVP